MNILILNGSPRPNGNTGAVHHAYAIGIPAKLKRARALGSRSL